MEKQKRVMGKYFSWDGEKKAYRPEIVVNGLKKYGKEASSIGEAFENLRKLARSLVKRKIIPMSRAQSILATSRKTIQEMRVRA